MRWHGGWLAVCVVLGAGALRAETVAGKVVDAGGAAVAGATVGAASFDSWAVDKAVVTRTDAAGAFRLEVPGEAGPNDVHLLALTDEPRRLGAYVGRAGLTLTIALSPLHAAAGVVVDKAGQPLAGVTLKVTNLTRPEALAALKPDKPEAPQEWELSDVEWPAAPWPVWSATTDAQGRWRCEALPVGGALTLMADDGTHLPTPLSVLDTQRDKPLKTVLKPAAAVSGRVTTADGQPVAGYRVVARHAHHDEYAKDARTDADGRYAIAGLWPDSYELCSGDPTAKLTGEARSGVRLRAGRTRAGVDLTVAPGQPLVVKVVQAPGGQPLAGAVLRGYGPSGTLSDEPSVRTGADGTVKLFVLPGEHNLWAEAAGTWLDVEGANAQVTVEAGKTPPTVTLKLTAGRTVSGVLTEAGGKALAQMELSVGAEKARAAYTTTDEAGKFKLAGLPATGPVTVTVTEPSGFQRSSTAVQASSLPATGWQLEVAPVIRCTVKGKVVDQDGRPVAEAAVSLQHANVGEAWALRTQSATSGADGTYSFAGLPVLEGYSLAATKPGFRPRAEVAPAANHRAPNLVLDELRRKLTGRVLDPAGQPLAGATVRVLGVADREATTDADGAFTLEKLPAGKLRVLAVAGRDAVAVTTLDGEASRVLLHPRTVKARTREQDRELAAELLAQAWKLARNEEYGDSAALPALLARLDPPAAVELVAVNPPATKQRDETLTALLVALAKVNTELCVENLPWLDKLPDETRAAARATVGAALAPRERAAAAKLFGAVAEVELTDVPGAVARVELAARLESPGAAKLAAKTLAQLGEAKDEARDGLLQACYRWAPWPALATLARAMLPADAGPAGDLMGVLGLLRTGDVAGAQARFTALNTPAMRAWVDGDGADSPLYALAVQRLAEALAPTRPGEAWSLVTLLSNEPPAVALATVLALSPDPAIGQRAEDLLRKLAEDNDDSDTPDMLALAKRLREEPNQARLECERQLATAPEEREPGELTDPALSLATQIDPRRAAEEASARGDAQQQAQQLRSVANWLLLEPGLRWVTERAMQSADLDTQVANTGPLGE